MKHFLSVLFDSAEKLQSILRVDSEEIGIIFDGKSIMSSSVSKI